MKAIILEGDGKWAFAIARAFEKLGITSERVTDPDQAEALLADVEFKVLSVDLNLGSMAAPSSGLDVLYKLDSLRPDVVPMIITDVSKEWRERLERQKKRDPFQELISEVFNKVAPWVIHKNMVADDDSVQRDRDLANGLPKLSQYFETRHLKADIVKRSPKLEGQRFTFECRTVGFRYEVLRSKLKPGEKPGQEEVSGKGIWRGKPFVHSETKVRAMLLLLQNTLRHVGTTNHDLRNELNKSYQDFAELFKGDPVWKHTFIVCQKEDVHGGSLYWCNLPEVASRLSPPPTSQAPSR